MDKTAIPCQSPSMRYIKPKTDFAFKIVAASLAQRLYVPAIHSNLHTEHAE
jgi:hypothetical protein